MVQNSPKAAPAPPPGAPVQSLDGLDRWFHITARGSNRSREIRGGLVTFLTMAYILVLNPLIIGTATDKNGNLLNGQPMFLDAAKTQLNNEAIDETKLMVGAATALVAGVLTILMGVWGRFPVALATGLGLNALLAYTIAPQMTWPQAMGLVVWEGILITVLVLTGVRSAIFRAVPPALRTAISIGIGLFITLVGLADAGIVRPGSPLLSFGVNGSLQGWPIAVCIFGFLLLIGLYVRKIKGAMLIAILTASVVGLIVERIFHIGPKIGAENPTGWMLNVPTLPEAKDFVTPNLGLLGKIDMFGAFAPDGRFSITIFLGLLLLVFSLLLADFFDTMGTVVAVGSEAGLLNKAGNPPHLKEILLVDSLGAVAGGLGSVSSNTSYIESAAGVGEGARTGFSSVVAGIAFLLAIFLAPIVNIVPSEAAGPVLAFVGFLMMSQVIHVDWDDVEDGIPAFLTIVLMPFTYSITVGIGAGFVLWVFIKLLLGKAKQVHPLLWAVAILFVVYFAQGILFSLLD
ncbi:NCS2 family permease [Aestuariimicrobium ganziense]|uniref:NCS2 family permease n=1 Tax=Aestuariimicrobium ganziense TaxID=2773677 RepID=UPI0019446223|nr:NCS2 family permease [Aestuariimicrobium ganziense]